MSGTPPPPPAGPRPTPREAAIAGILGLAPDVDAAGLIGVDPDRTDDGEIVAALNERLAKVNAHRYGGTPLGDEARLALHAAAAQLLGSRRRSTSFGVEPDQPTDLPARWSRPHALPPAHLALQQDAVLALGAHGGWNATTMRHLSMLAHARGLTGDDLAVALTRLARQSGPAVAPSGNGSGAVDDGVSDPGQYSPAEHALVHSGNNDLALLGAMAVAVVLTLVAAAAVLIAIPVMRNSGQAAQQAAAAEQPAPIATPSGPTPAERDAAIAEAQRPAEPQRQQSTTPDTKIDTIVTDLRLAAERRKKGNPSAQAVFERAVRTLANNWPRVRPDQQQAALGQVIDHLYLVREDPATTQRVVGFLVAPIAEGDGEPTLAARTWQVGAIVRLSKEQNLPAPAVEGLRSFILAEAPLEARAVGDFAAGVTVALRAELATLSEAGSFNADPKAWEAWLACVQGLAASEPALGHRLLLAGLEAVLLSGPDPTDERVFQIVRRLVVSLQWRPQDESRGRLLAWFDDPAITIADLHALTNVLATASGAPGVDPTMVLPVLASPAQRSQVRDRFAAAWNVQSAMAHGEVANRWLGEARRHLEAQPENTPATLAVDAAVSARLSAAATLLWQGQANEADTILMNLRDGLGGGPAQTTAGTRSIYLASHSDPSPWALRYLSQRRPELKADLLDELARRGPTHAVEAELIAEAFLRGKTIDVRERAGNLLGGYASKPVVIAAVLETFPLPGADMRRREMVEMVTGVRLPSDDAWELVARRTLVERLLQLMASEGGLARIDRAAEAIAQAYTRSLATGSAAQSDNPPELSAELLWNRARQRADRLVPPAIWPWSPGEVDRRLAGRTRLAQGRVQWFAAYQFALVEITLYNTAAERPSLAMRLADELTKMQDARREARGVLAQVSIVERARLESWRLRLSEAATGGPQ
ncbi:MAG: hypothetical protein NCW75_10510 [Phycisphaera sp.]|nr:MAG: hypothetical protein NCW75_10510 [Phycisphaera sp.]